MSVINRMLRDLDERQRQEQKKTTAPPAALAPTFPWGPVWRTAVVLVIVFIAIAVLWQNQVSKTPLPTVTANSDVAEQPTNATEQVSSAEQPAQIVTPPPVKEDENEIASLVSEQVNQNVQTAVLPELPDQEPALEQTDPVDSAGINSEAEKHEVVKDDASPLAEPEKENKGSLQIERAELTQEQLAELKYKQAKEALNKGERSRAGSLLEQVIALAPGHINARAELAAYWYGRGRVNDALAVLEQGLQLKPEQSRWLLLYGRILFNIAAYEELLRGFQNIPQEAAEAEELMQLRASSANELGLFEAAAEDYSWLATRTTRGSWWLAAAVAFEDAGQPRQAYNAYSRAAATNDLNNEGLSYARQRLQVLGEQ